MTARFILSLDCEGRWGVADQLESEHARALTDQALRRAYSEVLSALDRFAVPATFAFVAAFTLSPQRLQAARPELRRAAARVQGYVEHAVDASAGEGWAGDWALEAVRTAHVTHELALHGATHVPWDRPGFTAAAARAEMQLAFDLAPELARDARTFIYPRNRVEHRTVLSEFGLVGARDDRGRRSRVRSLAEEFLPARPEADLPLAEPIRIPAGHFLNWRCGRRRVIPPVITRERIRRSVAAAERTGATVHLWTHPENFASGPGTLDVLRGILEDVARARDAGRCEVLTQVDYCRTVDPGLFDRIARDRTRVHLPEKPGVRGDR
ncbi:MULTISPECIES: polysaccharide deacetylase family protein [Pseudonocardia]|uniref:Polysaccharide deacetylase n=2 Tax=Pseudonocardia TaxID=1847 RepID=A0A1Y2N8X8_PSEAH|nr:MULTISPECIES: polysaccharide deacetylase family protein [Pseudonocardia]OSY43651.1 hypothetical protein BG845_00597 [Pseudonocardia autotrophica]TDN73359.1 polysaccharide deacetylase [Pseudonocardia autotrophica]BBG04097.1 hypothetical protein Pdca_53060 [Pseudonocardia autotrophica]GEC26234.1 hypothetical protein PSA01_32630 [Pseudonocardia saturnea]